MVHKILGIACAALLVGVMALSIAMKLLKEVKRLENEIDDVKRRE